MTASWRLCTAIAVGLLAGCALPGVGGDDERARVAVVVQRGFASRPAPAAPAGDGVALLLDMTPSMATASDAGVGRFVAARAAAARFVQALPADTAVAVHAIGAEVSPPCAGELRSRVSAGAADRAELLADLASLEPAGTASLAAGLTSLRGQLAAGGALGGARIAVFSDLDARCGGDLCGAISETLAGGARVDLVVFGDAELPACFAAGVEPGIAGVDADSPAVSFRVLPAGRRSRPVAGESGGEAIAVPAGSAEIVVDLEPPLRLEAVPLLPGTTSRLTVLDFPALDPPVREWFWDLDGDAAADGDAGAIADGS